MEGLSVWMCSQTDLSVDTFYCNSIVLFTGRPHPWNTRVVSGSYNACHMVGPMIALLISLAIIIAVSSLIVRRRSIHGTKSQKKTDDAPQVSVVVITLNEDAQIKECIHHISSCNPPCKEIIVSDGGSTDNTIDIVRSIVSRNKHTDGEGPVVSLVQCGERGRARQMNAGARACTGDLVMFVHADSRPPLDCISHIRTSLSSPGTIMGGFKSRISIMDAQGREEVLWFPTLHQYFGFDFYAFVFRPWQYIHGLRCLFGDQNIFCRRDEFFKVGGFDDSLVIMEDVDLCLRMFDHFRTTRSRCLIDRCDAWSITSGRRIAAWGSLRATVIHFRIGLGWFLFRHRNSRDRLYREYHTVYTDDYR